MRKLILTGIVLSLLAALPVLAQEEQMASKPESAEEMTPPKPLTEDKFCSWMVGEWVGTSESSNGNSEDWMRVDMKLENNYALMHYKGKMTTGQYAGMTYEGMGPVTINPATGEYVGFWFGTMRDMSQGTGKQEGNKVTMTWQSPQGTHVRTTEMTGPDKMHVTFKEMDSDGNVISEGTSKLSRKKKES